MGPLTVSLLAVDLGKTKCRVRLCQDGGTVESVGPGAPGLAGPGGAAQAEAAILAVALPLLRAAGLARVERLGVAAAGSLAAPAAAKQLAARLRDRFPAGDAMVCSDATAAHAGALAGRPGVVLAIGTGAVAVAVGTDGTAHRADGWGPWLGDKGGGAWLGLHGLRAALRHHDGSGPATLLRAAAEARFGSLPALAATIEAHANPARLAASFAPDVAAMSSAGDAVATALLGRAAAALAATAGAAAARLPDRDASDLAITGGLVALGPALMDALVAALPARLRHRAAEGGPLDGAALLASDVTTVHEPAVHRTGRAAAGGQGRDAIARHGG